MTLEELLTTNRSYRRFHQDQPLDKETLIQLVGLTRLCPSAANRQPLKYMISWEPDQNTRIFETLAWAAALPDWKGPAEGERPAGYIVILGDTRIAQKFDWDCGIVAQSMLLSATERGLGGCMIGSINKPKLRDTLDVPEHLEVLLVLALGKPSETVVLEHGVAPESRPYWRDEQDRHHVPKRTLDELLRWR